MKKNPPKQQFSRILGISLFILISLVSIQSSEAKNIDLQNNSNVLFISEDDSPWILGFTDNLLEIHYQILNCDGKEMVKLRIVNRSKNSLKFNYKLWKSMDTKVFQIEPLATLEGICALGYNYPLMEQIPESLKREEIKLLINYIKQ
ncbi:MAG: hypothetical protein ACOVO9_06540 [Bacteroidia bacterium]